MVRVADRRRRHPSGPPRPAADLPRRHRRPRRKPRRHRRRRGDRRRHPAGPRIPIRHRRPTPVHPRLHRTDPRKPKARTPMSAPTMFGDATTALAAGFNPLDATSVIAATGIIGILCVLIAETGLLVGFFLPGDSLLFTAGILAASHGALHLPLGWVLLAATAGALIGAQIGYWIGRTLGTRLLERT